MVTKSDPIVSICCITYNHAPFIRQSIEGMLMQQGVDYEILIHDDCSTDGTTEIVKEYAAKYPDLIFPLYEEVNQYQNGKAGEIDFFNYKRARGKYIAYCEGDDYWTDPLKLQKQVEFMEAHEDYSVCFHEFTTYDYENKAYRNQSQYSQEGDFDITASMLINGTENIAQPLTMLFRTVCWSPEWQKHYTRYCDSLENYHLLKAGKGRFMRFNGGQYNLRLGGISAFYSNLKRSKDDCEDYQQMWDYTHDSVILPKYLKVFLWRLQVCKDNKMINEYWKTAFYALVHNPSIGITVIKKALIRRFK